MAQIKTRIVLRNDITANWESLNPILSKAEAGLEFCTDGKVKIKIGNGTETWNDLEYFGGTEVFGDNKSVEVINGVVSIKGFTEAEAGAQPRKKADGTIEWILPDTTTVEGLSSTVEGLKQDVKNIQDIIGVNESGELPLINRIETLEEKINGTGENSIDAKINEKINEFATSISNDGVVNSFKELVDYVAEHGNEVNGIITDIADLQRLVGSVSVNDQIAEAIANAGHVVKEEAKTVFEKVAYEIAHKPAGTLINMLDKEIRIMIPKGYEFTHQNSGENADSNLYYVGFKAYAPSDDVVSFKEDLGEIITDTEMYYFENNDFAGIDTYGRKYSIVWLPVASFNGTEWMYYGAKSKAERFIGWYYSVEWYNKDGLVIHSDTIRINLSNEECHNDIHDYVNVNDLVQNDGDFLVLNGGNA